VDSPERRFVEESAVLLTGMGLPPAYAKILAWLLICDPPCQTATDIARELHLSKGSVSAGIRVLERIGLARRVPAPSGRRGAFWAIAPDAIMRASVSDTYATVGELMQRGVEAAGGEGSPRAERLRVTRDFYIFLAREFPRLVERFREEYLKEGDGDG